MASQRSPVRRLEMEVGPPALISAAVRRGATKVETPQQSGPRTQAHEDCKSVVEELLSKLKRSQARALLNVVWTLFRPIVIPLCFVAIIVLLSNNVPLWNAGWLPLTAPLGIFVLFGGWGLIKDPIFLRSVGLDTSGVPAGVFYKPKTDLEKVMQRCNFEASKYKAPFWCINGDWSTIASELIKVRPVKYQRINIPHDGDAPVPVDISLETTSVPFRESSPILVILAGVGGDSDAKYVQYMCHAAAERGWMSAVILPRGLGNHAVEDVKKVFNPCDLSTMHAALSFLSAAAPSSPLLGVGFSMGACMYCNYLSRFEAPRQLKAVVAVCGAFKFYDFTTWHRYVDVFQPLIIPEILSDLVAKYGAQLTHQLGLVGLKLLCTSDRYSQLSQRLFSKVHNVPGDYADWQALQEPLNHRHQIKTPLLLFTAQDDPLHHCGMIAAETDPSNPHIAYYVTKTGGHVAWPTGTWPKDYSFMTGVVSRFLKENLGGEAGGKSGVQRGLARIAIPESVLARNIPGYRRSDSGNHMLDEQDRVVSSSSRRSSLNNNEDGGNASPLSSIAIPESVLARNIPGYRRSDSGNHMLDEQDRVVFSSSRRSSLVSHEDGGNASPLSVKNMRAGSGDDAGRSNPRRKSPTDEDVEALPSPAARRSRRKSLPEPMAKPRPGVDLPPLAADFFLLRNGSPSPGSRRSSRSSLSSTSLEPSSPLSGVVSNGGSKRQRRRSSEVYPKFVSHGRRKKPRAGAGIWVQAATVGVVYLLAAGVVLYGMGGALWGAEEAPTDASVSDIWHHATRPHLAGYQPSSHQRLRVVDGLRLAWMAVSREAIVGAVVLLCAASFSVFSTHRIAVREKEVMTWLRDMEDAPRRAVWESALGRVDSANGPGKKTSLEGGGGSKSKDGR